MLKSHSWLMISRLAPTDNQTFPSMLKLLWDIAASNQPRSQRCKVRWYPVLLHPIPSLLSKSDSHLPLPRVKSTLLCKRLETVKTGFLRGWAIKLWYFHLMGLRRCFKESGWRDDQRLLLSERRGKNNVYSMSSCVSLKDIYWFKNVI